MTMNILPTEATKDIAAAMLRMARAENGADAVMRYLEEVRWDQVPALVGVILNEYARVSPSGEKPGPKPAGVGACLRCKFPSTLHGRGLCYGCYTEVKNAGDLLTYPRLDARTRTDPQVVARILNGEWQLTATLSERLAVLDRFKGTQNELERLTGWNVSRDLRRSRKGPESPEALATYQRPDPDELTGIRRRRLLESATAHEEVAG